MMRPDILLCDGRYFSFTEPDGFRVSIHTIAHALSNICRFGGHCSEFYSVAQHSVVVSRILANAGFDTGLQMMGLLHDASEAFVGDMPSPLKHMCADYSAVEKRVESALMDSFGYPHTHPHEIKKADLVALAMEDRDLMPKHSDVWGILEGVTPMIDTITPLPPLAARELFLCRYEELGGIL
jgi:hypothetical protein